MRLTGHGIWGPPDDHDEAIRVLRRAVELGVDFIDTADSYGPYVSEELIREALHPYRRRRRSPPRPGLLRTGPDEWVPLGRPEYLRQEVRDEPAPARRRAHRPVPAAPHRPASSRSRTSSASSSTLQAGGQDPAHRPVRGRRRPDQAAARGRPDRVGAEPATTSPTATAEPCSTRASRARHRLHPVVPARRRRARRSRRPAAAHRRRPRRHPVAARAGLAAASAPR